MAPLTHAFVFPQQGAGMLGLPYAFKRSGTVEGAVFLVMIAFLSWHAIMTLLQTRRFLVESRHERAATYGDVAEAAYGQLGRTTVNLLLVLSQTGFCVAYLVFIGQNLASVSSWPTSAYIMALIPALISLSLVKSLTKLAPFSLVADVLNLFGLLVIFRDDTVAVLSTNHLERASWSNVSNLPFLFGVFIYCYEGIGMMLPLESSMAEPEKFARTLTIGICVITALFVAFGAIGYEAFGDDTSDIVTLNLPKDPTTTAVKMCMSVGLLFTFPVMMVPVWEILEAVRGYKRLPSSDGGDRDDDETKPPAPQAPQGAVGWGAYGAARRIAVVLGLVVAAIGVPGFSIFVSLVGSVCCGSLAFILPALLHLKLVGAKRMSRYELILDSVLIAVGVAGMIAGTSNTLYELLVPSPSELVVATEEAHTAWHESLGHGAESPPPPPS